MGLVLIEFIVERHLIQETIHLPKHRKENQRATHLLRDISEASHLLFCQTVYVLTLKLPTKPSLGLF